MMRRLVDALVPPVAVQAWRRLRPPPRRFHGVFDSPEEISGPSPWDRDDYVAATEARLRAVCSAQRPDPDFLPTAFLIGALAHGGSCRVLDFAGGAGIVYHAIRPFLARPEGVRWDVVDNPRLVEVGRRYCEDEGRPGLLEELPDPGERYDVVHVNTSLQYIDDPYAILERLCAHRPDWLVLTRLLAGDTPAFLTSQLVQGVPVACRFLNMGELVGWCRDRGYSLVLRCPVVDGDFRDWYAPSVPHPLRQPHAIHAVFRRDPTPAPGPTGAEA